MRVVTMNRCRLIAILAAGLFPLLGLSDEREWGHLTGRFLYEGDPPPKRAFPITRGVPELGDTFEDESLIVNDQNLGIANIIVYLLPQNDDELPVHPSYARTANANVELVMQNGRFVPHILLLRTTQTMTQRNQDKFAHNAMIGFIRNSPM